MLNEFFRFPHTPHLAWLGAGQPRDDKVLSTADANELLAHDVLVEEKVDGANIGFSTDADGSLRIQNRGTFLVRGESHPQFKPLFGWLTSRQAVLVDALYPSLMLFGEWCYAQHTVHYTRLPDWLLAFDVYDRSRGVFWSSARRNALVHALGIEVVPPIATGRFNLSQLVQNLGQSRISDGPNEGLYVRWETDDRLIARAKLVAPQFTQAIQEHWSRRALRTNALATSRHSTRPSL